jgi:UDP-glucose 4-epimerase
MTTHKDVAVVTGASGFLAKNLIPTLLEQGWRVIAVSREKSTDHAYQTLTWEEFWTGNLLDPTQIKAVFHLAAFIPPNMEDSAYAAECLNTNSLLTLRLAEHIGTHSKGRFIHCSSGQVYRFQKRAATECQHVPPPHRACFYLASKLLSETYVERTRKALGLDTIIFRVGSCYGPGMPERSLVSRFLAFAEQGKPLPLRNGGAEQFDLVYAPDVVRLLIRGATSTKQGLFNAGSGHAVTVRQVAETVNRIIGNQAGVVYEEPSTPPLQPGFAPLSTVRTLKEFGWNPRTLSEGLKDFRSWIETSRAL